jgi:hypothetical protein
LAGLRGFDNQAFNKAAQKEQIALPMLIAAFQNDL